MIPSELKILLDCIPSHCVDNEVMTLSFGYIIKNSGCVDYNLGYKMWCKLVTSCINCTPENMNIYVNYCYNVWPYMEYYTQKIVMGSYDVYAQDYINSLSIVTLEEQCKYWNKDKYKTYYNYTQKVKNVNDWINDNLEGTICLRRLFTFYRQDHPRITWKTFRNIIKESYNERVFMKKGKLYLNNPYWKNIKKTINDSFEQVIDKVRQLDNFKLTLDFIVEFYKNECIINNLPVCDNEFKNYVLSKYNVVYNLRNRKIITLN